MLTEITFVVGIGITNPPQIKDPSEKWHARFYDPRLGQFFAGNGASAWEAVAWSLVEREERLVGLMTMARNPSDTPAAALARVDVVKRASAALDVPAKEIGAAVNAFTIATTHEPVRLPIAGACTPETKAKTAAARRARAKKGADRGQL